MSYLLSEADRYTMDALLEEVQAHLRTLSAEIAKLTAKADRLDAVLDVCDRADFEATRWADPFPVPPWVGEVRNAALEGRDLTGLAKAAARGLELRRDVWNQIMANRRELDLQINLAAAHEANAEAQT
jgi:hypothetical protein